MKEAMRTSMRGKVDARLVRPPTRPRGLIAGRTRRAVSGRGSLPFRAETLALPPTQCEVPTGKVTTFPKERARLTLRQSEVHGFGSGLPRKWGLGVVGVLEGIGPPR